MAKQLANRKTPRFVIRDRLVKDSSLVWGPARRSGFRWYLANAGDGSMRDPSAGVTDA